MVHLNGSALPNDNFNPTEFNGTQICLNPNGPPQRRARSAPTARGPKPLLPRSLKEALQLAELLSKSKLIPKGFETPETCLVGILYGMEVGLSPIAALQRMAVIDGRPTIWGDAALALVQASGLLTSIREEIIGNKDVDGEQNIVSSKRSGDGTEDESGNRTAESFIAICTVKREGRSEPVIGTFSVDDAKRAGLWQKPGPWTDYPKRMLTMRARAFALRDAFPDVLSGLYIREEFEGSKSARPIPIEPQKLSADEEWAQAADQMPFNAPSTPRTSSAVPPETKSAKPSSPIRRAPPPPPPEDTGVFERTVEIGSNENFRNSTHSDVAECEHDVFDPEIVLDLFDSALCCGLDLPTLEEIIDDFAVRLGRLPTDARKRVKLIIERHQNRVAEIDRSPATDVLALKEANNAEHHEYDHDAERRETTTAPQQTSNEEPSALPRGLKPLLSTLGLGRMPAFERRRKSSNNRNRSLSSWNARTRLSDFREPSFEDEITLADDVEQEE